MPQLLPLLKKDEVLPLFVQQRSSKASISICRKWNSLHRLNRSFIIAVLILVVFCIVFIQMVSLPSQVEKIGENSENVSEFLINKSTYFSE